MRTSSPSPAEVLVSIRHHVADVLNGDVVLPPAAIRALVAVAKRSGIEETVTRRAISEAVAAALHPLVAKAVQVLNGEVVEVARPRSPRREAGAHGGKNGPAPQRVCGACG